MKRLFQILFFLLTINFSYGQTDSLDNKNVNGQTDSLDNKNDKNTPPENKIFVGGLVGSLNSFQYNEGANFFVGVSVEKKRNFLAVAPIVGGKLIDLYYNGFYYRGPRSLNGINLNGINTIYQFSPHYQNKIINVFFQYQFVYRFYKAQGNTHLFSSSISEPIKGYYSLVENDLSVGLKIKFLKQFYFTSCVGVGYAVQRILNDYKHFTDRVDELKGFTVSANVCLGYKFISKK